MELAAKAYGLASVEWVEENKLLIDMDAGRVWNPLTDDGDALRLAFKIGMSIDMSAMIIGLGPNGEYGELEFENIDGTLEEVRRAIVRAAAAIGRVMP